MREIKFRAKRIDNGAWVYGHYFQSPLTDENSGASKEAGWFFLTGEKRHCIEQNGVVYIVDPETVGQFIGLYDSEKNEIYEGDIVAAQGGNEHQGYREFSKTCHVEFVNGSFQLVYQSDGSKVFISFEYFHIEDVEIIDNIFDSPGFLEERT